MQPHTIKLISAFIAIILGISLSAQSLRRDTMAHVITYGNGLILGEREATFPGGIEAWDNYIIQNIQLPKKAAKQKKEGMVLVWFKVDSLGNIIAAKALNDPGCGLAEAAVRVVRDGPKWIPAEQSGLKVNYCMVHPVVFNKD
jgi:hypothetical protein